MPKIVNHKDRKVKIAEATWSVIVQEGLENASVRKIASKVGLSVGALRHYFPSQSELFLFSMELVSDRVNHRIQNTSYKGPPLQVVEDVLCEVLPIDEERIIEMEVWLVFSAKTLVDRKLEELSREVFRNMRNGIEKIIDMLDTLQLMRTTVDCDLEVTRLHALIDGLAMHHILHPETITKKTMVSTVTYHLQSICK